MNFSDLAGSYLEKAVVRLKVLDLLLAEEAWSDVVREAQEAVELALEAVLRQAGVEPPKWHDVSGPLLEFADRLSLSILALSVLFAKLVDRTGATRQVVGLTIPRPGAQGPEASRARRKIWPTTSEASPRGVLTARAPSATF